MVGTVGAPDKENQKRFAQSEISIKGTKVGLRRRNFRQEEPKEIFTVGIPDKKNQSWLALSEHQTIKN